LDVDGDWALTAAEAQVVAADPNVPPGRTPFDEWVVMRLHRRSTPGDVLYWLQQIYSLGASGDGAVTTASQQQALNAPAGLNSSEHELEPWESDLSISVSFSEDGPPQLKLVPATPEETVIRVVEESSASGPWKLEVGGMPMAIEVQDAWSQWAQRMRSEELMARLDKDANGQLGREELAAEGLEMLVAGVEDESATLSTDELPSAIARLADGRRATVRIDVSPARDVWIGLDQNRDGRLGEREMQQAQQVVMQQDHGGDGVVRAEEILRGLVIRITRPAPAVAARPAEAPATASASEDNATTNAWFDAMDLNQDGEISAREFPGARETFQKLDADGDGFVEPSEVPVAEETA
jgi:Ca2+-binding EF-hand superfamily protein